MFTNKLVTGITHPPLLLHPPYRTTTPGKISFDDFQQSILRDGGGGGAGGVMGDGDDDVALELVGGVGGAGGAGGDAFALANIKVTPRRLDGLDGLPDGMEEEHSVHTLTVDMLAHIKVRE